MHRIPVRGDEINDLERLYVREVDNPVASQDYGSPGTLREDVFRRLVDLFACQELLPTEDQRKTTLASLLDGSPRPALDRACSSGHLL